MATQLTPKMQDVLDKIINELDTRINSELDINTLFKIDTEIAELNSVWATLLDTKETELGIKLEELTTTVQQKLDNGDFKGQDGYTPKKGIDYFDGEDGTSITNVENSNNQLLITDSNNKKYNLGNYVNDYNNLINKPHSYYGSVELKRREYSLVFDTRYTLDFHWVKIIIPQYRSSNNTFNSLDFEVFHMAKHGTGSNRYSFKAVTGSNHRRYMNIAFSSIEKIKSTNSFHGYTESLSIYRKTSSGNENMKELYFKIPKNGDHQEYCSLYISQIGLEPLELHYLGTDTPEDLTLLQEIV
ncbi:MAG: hypothetical protein ACQERD_01000 [Campylobacterota bacterium]